MILRQSTQTIVHIGPLLSNSDGTPYTQSATLAPGTADLFKSGSLVNIDLYSRSWAHVAAGMYALTLVAGDLDTLGPLQVHVHAANVHPALLSADVLSAAAFDAMCGGARFGADVQAIAGNPAAAGRLSMGTSAIQPIVVQAGPSSTTVPTDLSQAGSSFFNGRTLLMVSGVLAGQQVAITGYNGATKVLTVSQLTTAPSVGDQGVIV